MEKRYEIYVNHYESDSLNMLDLKRQLETELNADSALIDSVKRANIELFDKLKTFCGNPENAIFSGANVIKFLSNTPRYSYQKNLELDGKAYDLEIDALTRRAELLEISK